MEDKKTGVLLLNFGAPEKPSEVEEFITHISQGKPSENIVSMLKERYALIGGGSPLNAITRKQAERLGEELKKQGKDYPVYFGMLHSKPFISERVGEMIRAGIKKILAISLAPFYSRVSTGAYYSQVQMAVKNNSSEISVIYGGEWNTQPFFIASWAEKISQSLKVYPDPREVNLIFTAHSLPVEPIEDALNYQRQFQEAVQAVREKLPYYKSYLAYQSKGQRLGNWLHPQVEEVIEMLSLKGVKQVLAVPIGFAADHLETLYDLDIEVKKQAELREIHFRRISALNDDPGFIRLLTEMVLKNSTYGLRDL